MTMITVTRIPMSDALKASLARHLAIGRHASGEVGHAGAFETCAHAACAAHGRREHLEHPMRCHHCGWQGAYRDVVQAGLNHELCPKCEETVHPVEGYPAAAEG